MEKQEYKVNARQYDTRWLGKNISISNGDLTVCHGRNCNRAELKRNSPILNWAQLLEFGAAQFHIVVHFNGDIPGGKVSFDSPVYDIYCPHQPYKVERIERGWLLNGQPCRVSRSDALQIFRAEACWPCCQRFTITNGVATCGRGAQESARRNAMVDR